MSKRVKYYSVYGKAVDSDGEERYVTIVGKFEQTREQQFTQDVVPVEVKPNTFINGVLTYKEKKLRRSLTLSLAICHPTDEFSEEEGIKVGKRRIKDGQVLGTVETSDITMLTEDAIYGELLVKLNYVIEHIDDYIQK